MKQPLALARREGGQRRRLSGKFGGSRQTTTNFFVAKELMADGILMHLCICNSSAIIQPTDYKTIKNTCLGTFDLTVLIN